MTIEEKREKTRLRNIEWRKKNPEGYLKAAAKYRNENRDKLRDYKWKSRYNITPEQYAELFCIQKGQCAICNRPETAININTNKVQKLAVDHCHKTGKVRGLLCRDCNRGIGKFQDDPVRLQNAIKYLNAL